MTLRLGCALMLAAATSLAAQDAPAALQPFRNRSGTFQINLPAGWRQLAPNEARKIAELPGAPTQLGYVEPRMFYAVGPVDDWLAGRFAGPWLWVVEQEHEWVVGDDLEQDVAPKLREMWDRQGAAQGTRHEIGVIRREKFGPRAHEAITTVRTTTPRAPAPATRSLDVYAPAGGQQFSLSFTTAEADFARAEPEFRLWLATLSFARAARGTPTLSDRLWNPLLVFGLVSVVLLVLYKHTRGRPPS